MVRRLRAGAASLALNLVLACAPPAPLEPRPEEPGGAVVEVGLERLTHAVAELADDSGPAVGRSALDLLAGKRLGLVVHAASVTSDGRHAIDVFSEAGLEVVRLFAPEHGLRGRAAAGEKVASGRDAATGLPVVSLYGEHRRPQPEDLADLEALVFDLQGAGVRFYTYVSTLILTLEAAAEADLDFFVLDRPNPLGGERVEGPPSAPREVVPASFVNLAPGPLIHGLTLAEMASYVNAGLARPARLRVVPMAGWRRSMTWAETGRPWVSPSPNLRSPQAAMAYPGVALLEATNVSEGRGTEQPFLFLGAPWLAGFELDLEVEGFSLAPVRFTPTASAAAPWARYLGEECAGWRVRVTDARRAEPYRLGLELVRALGTHPSFEWRRGGEALTRLLGTPGPGEALAAGRPVEEILAADRADQDSWRRAVREHWLYADS